jgi:predicted nuclease of predicted toxin-antitoxin system
MRFLIDNALSPALAELLREAGHVAPHVRDVSMQQAPDDVIFERAATGDLVVVSADTDFATLLAIRSASKPSLILFRGQGSRMPQALSRLILENEPQLRDALVAGSIVTFEPSRIRVRRLPIVATGDGAT